MILIYLFLGHFIADFLLQPKKLVDWKNRSWKGLAVHATIHFLVMSLLLYLYLPNPAIFFLSAPVALAHYFIDSIKSSHQKKSKNTLAAYWIDQAFHYLTLVVTYFLGAGYLMSRIQPLTFNGFLAPVLGLYINPVILIFLSLSIFVTLTIEYGFHQARPKTYRKIDPLDYRSMFRRLFIISLIYIGLLFMFPSYISAFMY